MKGKKGRVLTKSEAAKKARAGTDMGSPGKGFASIVEKAKASGATNPEAVAGAVFQKKRRAGTL